MKYRQTKQMDSTPFRQKYIDIHLIFRLDHPGKPNQQIWNHSPKEHRKANKKGKKKTFFLKRKKEKQFEKTESDKDCNSGLK